jgi:hypothetical protein
MVPIRDPLAKSDLKSAFSVDMKGSGSLRDLGTVPSSDGTHPQSSVTCVEGECASLFELFFDHCSDPTGRDQVGFQRELIGYRCQSGNVHEICCLPSSLGMPYLFGTRPQEPY